MDAPAAYQKGPEIPKFHATLDDWRRVAAHVHWEPITAAVRPVLTSRPAVLKCSEVILTLLTLPSNCRQSGQTSANAGATERTELV